MKEAEQWKFLKELDDNYEISNYGRVKSFMVDKTDGRLISPKITRSGYTLYVIRYKGGCVSFYAHRKVGEYYVPNPNNYSYVDHIKNDKSLNYAWELQWMEHVDNVRKDQAKIIVCISPTGEEIEASGTRHAAELAGTTRSSVMYCLKHNNRNRKGWKFKNKKQ